MVKLVEKRIYQMLKQSQGGALLFDGWSCGRVHYVTAIASYCAKVSGDNIITPHLSVLCISLMGRSTSLDVSYGEYDAEVSRFNAVANLEYFHEVFKFSDLSFQSGSSVWFVITPP